GTDRDRQTIFISLDSARSTNGNPSVESAKGNDQPGHARVQAWGSSKAVADKGSGTVVVQEVSSLAEQLPEYRSDLEAKIRSLPGAGRAAGVLRRGTSMAQELGRELKQSEAEISASAGDRSALGASPAEPAKPILVEIQRPEFEPLQIVQGIVGPLLQPLAMA